MSEQLNLKRLGMLIRRHWWENAKFYSLAALAFTGLLILVFGIIVIATRRGVVIEEETVVGIYFVGLFLIGTIFASMGFAPLSDKSKGIYWMSIPASHTEKLITIIFYTMIVFPVAYTAAYLIVRELALLNIPVNQIRAMREDAGAGKWTAFGYFMLAGVAMQALYLLGGIYFIRFAYIKTLLTVAVIIMLFVWMVSGLDANQPKGVEDVMHVSRSPWAVTYYMKDAHQMRVYKIPEAFSDGLIFLMKFIWAPVFWLVAWFRLREKQL